ncbi:hypothetical protein [Ligilactobacillus equi]|uniref:Uncharacterized protein n=1 Tax=Ligilactobacillus equi DSM 15833 = JCM 10991 TaxID=1423740 RepID=A0A0R1TQX3_9LACO|nr:hypothetical protein [Ligilactobacillus equi]KRL80882.1 hypothetical protein FC36_GL002075 [Ligilactobacillus equi DSM 15833 = JCM 10991]
MVRKQQSEERFLRDKLIQIAKIVGMNNVDIAKVLGLTPQKIGMVDINDNPPEINAFIEGIIFTYSKPDEDGMVSPTLKDLKENYTPEHYMKWVKNASDVSIRTERSRIYSVLRESNPEDKNFIVMLTSINALLLRELDIRKYTRLVKESATLKDAERRYDAKKRQLARELAENVETNRKKEIHAEKKAEKAKMESDKRIAALNELVAKREEEVSQKRKELAREIRNDRSALARVRAEVDKANSEQEELLTELEVTKAELKQIQTQIEMAKSKLEEQEKPSTGKRPAKRVKRRAKKTTTEKTEVKPIDESKKPIKVDNAVADAPNTVDFADYVFSKNKE